MKSNSILLTFNPLVTKGSKLVNKANKNVVTKGLVNPALLEQQFLYVDNVNRVIYMYVLVHIQYIMI